MHDLFFSIQGIAQVNLPSIKGIDGIEQLDLKEK